MNMTWGGARRSKRAFKFPYMIYPALAITARLHFNDVTHAAELAPCAEFKLYILRHMSYIMQGDC